MSHREDAMPLWAINCSCVIQSSPQKIFKSIRGGRHIKADDQATVRHTPASSSSISMIITNPRPATHAEARMWCSGTRMCCWFSRESLPMSGQWRQIFFTCVMWLWETECLQSKQQTLLYPNCDESSKSSVLLTGRMIIIKLNTLVLIGSDYLIKLHTLVIKRWLSAFFLWHKKYLIFKTERTLTAVYCS